MRTVRQALEDFASEHGATLADLFPCKLNEHLGDPQIPTKYQELLGEVLLRLPEGWDSHAHWHVVAGAIDSPVDRCLAGARLLEAEHGDLQQWEVRIDADSLERFSDAAVRWILAHELAHVASGLPTSPCERDTALCEDRADHIAMVWGFEYEQTAFNDEREQQFGPGGYANGAA